MRAGDMIRLVRIHRGSQIDRKPIVGVITQIHHISPIALEGWGAINVQILNSEGEIRDFILTHTDQVELLARGT